MVFSRCCVCNQKEEDRSTEIIGLHAKGGRPVCVELPLTSELAPHLASASTGSPPEDADDEEDGFGEKEEDGDQSIGNSTKTPGDTNRSRTNELSTPMSVAESHGGSTSSEAKPEPSPDREHLGPGDFSNLLNTGRLYEAQKLLETHRKQLDPDRVRWLEEILPLLASASKYMGPSSMEDIATALNAKWQKVDTDEPACSVHLLRSGDIIQFRAVMELPATLEHAAAINWDIDLNGQWMPFNPTVTPTHSKSSASLLTHLVFKIPILPGSREMFTYRVVLDCLSPEAGCGSLPQGVMFVDVSPECWKTGGSYMGEFQIPPRERWVTRDKAQMQVAFWEPLTATSSRLTIWGEVSFNVPRFLLPDGTVMWMVKQIVRSSKKNLIGIFKDMGKYGYQKRIDESPCPLYKSLRERVAIAIA